MISPPHSRTRLAWPVLVALCGSLVGAPPVEAHRVTSVSLLAHFDTKQGRYSLDAAMEVVPSDDLAYNDEISPEDAAREFAGFLVVKFGENEVEPELLIEVEEASDEDTPPELQRQQVMTRLSGPIPEGSGDFLLYVDPRCPMAVVMVVAKDEQISRRMQVILSGEYSRPVTVRPVEEGDPFSADPVESESPGEASDTAEGPSAPDATGPASAPTILAPRNAFVDGFRSALVETPLAALLALAMLLLTLGRTSTLWQLSAVFVGLAPALALSVSLVLPPCPWAVEAAGALVAAVALEALFHHHVRWWRYPLLAAAGAAVGALLATLPSLRALLLEKDPGALAPLLVPLGAGSALLLATFAAAAILLPLGGHSWYRKLVAAPLAVLVAGVAGFLALDRFL